MPDKISAYSFSEDEFSCPACNAIFSGAAPVTGAPQGFKKGTISICAHCGAVLQLGDAAFYQMLPGDIAKLPTISQDTIKQSQQMVMARIAANVKKNGGTEE